MQSEGDNKKESSNIILALKDDLWEVSTEGDSAVLFSSAEKKSAEDFAKNMAETHKVKLIVEDGEKKEEKDSNAKSKILVINDREAWIVRTENDSAVLFSSEDKNAAIDFANQMGKEHKVDVKIK
jgi:ribosomal protein L10